MGGSSHANWVFGFYRQSLTLYELYILPWIYILSRHPQPGTLPQNEETELIHNQWTPDYQRLLEYLNKDIISGPNLEIPDPYQRFYINTYCFKYGIGGVLLQEYDSV